MKEGNLKDPKEVSSMFPSLGAAKVSMPFKNFGKIIPAQIIDGITTTAVYNFLNK